MGFGNRLQLVDLSLLKSGCLHGWCVDESPAASSHTDLFQNTLWRSRATCLVDESCWVMCSVSIQKKPASLRIIDIITLEIVHLLYLVGGLEHFLCSIIFGIIHQPLTNSIIFQDGHIAPPTSYISRKKNPKNPGRCCSFSTNSLAMWQCVKTLYPWWTSK